jgi:hypothetical protein
MVSVKRHLEKKEPTLVLTTQLLVYGKNILKARERCNYPNQIAFTIVTCAHIVTFAYQIGPFTFRHSKMHLSFFQNKMKS